MARTHLAALRAVVRQSGTWGCGLTIGERSGRHHFFSTAVASSVQAEVIEWTGLRPAQCPGFDAKTGKLGSLATPRLELRGQELRRELEDYFENGWTLTEVLFTSLRNERVFYQPAAHGLRHPLIFYYAHPAALAINKMRVASLIDAPLRADFEQLFETGVDEMRWDDVVDVERSPRWPKLHEVTEYRAKAREVVLNTIRHHPAFDREPPAEPHQDPARWCIAMICEHERIHLETSSVLIRELDIELIQRPAAWPLDHPTARAASSSSTGCLPQFSQCTGGEVRLGKARSTPSFGWDNEYGSRLIQVGDFESSRLVTNGQFLEFVKAGGYRDPQLWDEAGWGWRTFRNVKWPHFWSSQGPQGLHMYRLRLPFEETEQLPLDLPAEVNAHEARAYARWLNRRDNQYVHRLTTEAEHHLLRKRDGVSPTLDGADDRGDSGYRRLASINLNLAYGSPSSVCDDITAGNVWQWCEDDFAALPGFDAHWLYDDFSSPCFDGQHTVIHGGSFVSTGNEASAFARFHFRPHFHQHAGFRLTRNALGTRPPQLSSYDAPPPYAQGWRPLLYSQVVASSNAEEGQHKYETEAHLEAYLELHFNQRLSGPAASFAARLDHALSFPARCAEKLVQVSGQKKSFLDVGCAVGGASYYAAQSFERVVGFDFSDKFASIAADIAAGRAVQTAHHTLQLPAQSRCQFLQGDACDHSFIDSLDGPFDAVLAANLLCRLPKPSLFLEKLPTLVANKGHVLIASPYSFMTEYTPSQTEWLNTTSLACKMADLGFRLVEETDMPLLIKDHDRKYQYIVSNGLLFSFDN